MFSVDFGGLKLTYYALCTVETKLYSYYHRLLDITLSAMLRLDNALQAKVHADRFTASF